MNSPWGDYYGMNFTVKTLGQRDVDIRVGRQRFRFKGSMTQELKKTKLRKAVTYGANTGGAMIVSSDEKLRIVPRIAIINQTKQSLPDLRRKMEAGLRLLRDQMATVVLSDEDSGRKLRPSVRAQFVLPGQSPDWCVTYKTKMFSRANAVTLYTGDSTHTVAHEAMHSVFGAPDEYVPFQFRPVGGRPNIMSGGKGPAVAHQFWPLAQMVQRALGGNWKVTGGMKASNFRTGLFFLEWVATIGVGSMYYKG